MLEVRVLPVASGRDRRAALNVAGPADDPPQAQAAGECRTARYLSAAAERTGAPEPGLPDVGPGRFRCCGGAAPLKKPFLSDSDSACQNPVFQLEVLHLQLH